MRGFAVILFIAVILTAGVAQAQYPRGVMAEDGTATWCTYCPYAYAGLDVMLNTYDATEFNSVRYYATSGGLGSAETDARISYYAIGGFPTVLFDGLNPVVGGSSETATGSLYDPLIRKDLGSPSPFKITINSVDLVQPDGSLDCTVEVMDGLSDIGNMKIRAVLLENNVTYSSVVHDEVTRDVLPDVNLTVSALGQTQNVVASFALTPSWVTANLWMVVFIQDDDTKEILQSVSTRVRPNYSIRYWAKGPRVVVQSPNSPAFDFQDFAIYNLGTNPDVIRATLTPGTLPSGWSVSFTDGTNTYTDYADVSLAAGEGRVFHMTVTPGASGYAQPKIVLSSNNLAGVTRTIDYGIVTDDLEVLVVDDDGAQTYETMHASALTAMGAAFGVWPSTIAAPTAADLAHFPIVSWHTAMSYPTLDAADRSAIGAYLNGGGKLFVSGQEIGWEMDDQGGASLTWYHTYLHANFVSDDSNQNTVNGITGDPISSGLSLALTASMNTYPDVVSPYDAAATPIFNYGTGTSRAGLKVDTGIYRVVYLSFGFEAITSAANRDLVTNRVISWLRGASDVPAPSASASGVVVRTWPNPTAGAVALQYDLPAASTGGLRIYGANGAVVRTLVRGAQEAGPHSVVWDGHDDQGQAVPSGVYFYRLESGPAAPAGRIVLTR